MTDLRKAAEMALEALEELAKLGNGDHYGNSDGNVVAQKAIPALRQALAQPEQEHESRITALEIRVAKLEKPMTDHEKQLMAGQRGLLRTAPPSKPWVSLTDNEIINTANEAPFDQMVKADDYIYIIARAIETALRSKNNG